MNAPVLVNSFVILAIVPEIIGLNALAPIPLLLNSQKLNNNLSFDWLNNNHYQGKQMQKQECVYNRIGLPIAPAKSVRIYVKG